MSRATSSYIVWLLRTRHESEQGVAHAAGNGEIGKQQLRSTGGDQLEAAELIGCLVVRIGDFRMELIDRRP